MDILTRQVSRVIPFGSRCMSLKSSVMIGVQVMKNRPDWAANRLNKIVREEGEVQRARMSRFHENPSAIKYREGKELVRRRMKNKGKYLMREAIKQKEMGY